MPLYGRGTVREEVDVSRRERGDGEMGGALVHDRPDVHPRPAEWPITSVHQIGLKLFPAGFFSRNPSLDIPKEK
jgi:hypothetical protein